ncbi:hypothetical protein AALC25_19235 [Lachnospiraceae bacterium 29-84]
MKHTIYGAALAIIAMLAFAILLGISGRSVRKNELETAINTAAGQSLGQLEEKGGYPVANSRELAADFTQALLLQIGSDSGIQVDILAADVEKGILDVKVTETYHNLLGKEEKIVCRRAVIMEEYAKEDCYCMITFLVDGAVYHNYSLYIGQTAVTPKEPQKPGKVFRYWKKQGEEGAYHLEGKNVEGDLVLEAVFS